MNLELIHKGSVKDIYERSEDELLFRFSDRYSIFDWGEMPDEIPQKGSSLALMGSKLLNYLNQRGFATHFIAQGADASELIVKKVDVPRGNIGIYQSRPHNILIPLEVIYRFGLPKGSSLLKKYKSEAEWKAAGFERAYEEGEWLPEVKLSYTTKLERIDRDLSDEEAKHLAGMSEIEWQELHFQASGIAKEIKKVFAEFDAQLWDGKLEFAFDNNRKIILVDSIGLDEMRLTYDGIPLSKEILRQYYLNSSWYLALNKAKKESPEQFKEYCRTALKEEPKNLPIGVISGVSSLYRLASELILIDPLQKKELQEQLKKNLNETLSIISRQP